MMKFAEILEEINTLCTEVKEIKEKQKTEINKYYAAFDELSFKERVAKRNENTEATKEFDQRITEYQERITDGELKIKLLQNNAKLALFNDVMPVVLEVLQKYNGKPYGVKTKEKICNEIKEKTNCYFYIRSGFSQKIYITPVKTGNTYNIECGTKYVNGECKPLLVDNKIQPVSMEDLEIFYINRTYFDDLDGTVKELKRLHAEAKKKQEELKQLCSQFNTLCVKGITSLDYNYAFNIGKII